jgi:flagellar hook-associated protein 3 FlgL
MTTRITNAMMSRTVLNDIQDVAGKLSETQKKLASGKQINKPSDDPYATSRGRARTGARRPIKP